jgi:putative transposase
MINYFRGKRLKDTFDGIFTQVVELLHSEGFVSLEVQYINGTPIESAANKYTFVWRGSIKTYDTRLRKKTRRILSEAEEVLDMENHENQPDEELFVEEFRRRTSRIQQKMNSTEVPKKIKKAVEKTAKESIAKILEYERALDIMGERNSYSKTDEGCHVHAHEGRRHEKQPVKAQLQHTDSHWKPVHYQLYRLSPVHRYPHTYPFPGEF